MIFKRFYREEEVHDVEGIGIGLYLAREIITMQGGYIKVTSTVGSGVFHSIIQDVKQGFTCPFPIMGQQYIGWTIYADLNGFLFSVAREIITMQGGYIKVTSTVGSGSAFSVFLPRK